MKMDAYPHGLPSWIDLQVPDQDAAKAFYGTLFGWRFEDNPVPGGGMYTMAYQGDETVAAISPLGEEMLARGVPPHWNTYVTVDDVDAVADRVESLGGTLAMPPFDVMDAGRMAAVVDPTGAALCLWQARGHAGAERVNEPHTFCWSELYTADPDACRAFYAELLGWEFQTMDMGGDGPSHDIRLGERQFATVLTMRPEWGGQVPPHWAVYIAVADLDTTLATAKAEGGSHFLEPHDIPNVGRFAGIADPQGAHLLVIQLAERD